MHEYLERARQSIEISAQGMSVDQLAWHPAGKWSTAEIMEHLTRTYAGTVRGLAKLVESGGRPMAERPTLAERARTLLVIQLGYFPSGRRAPDFAQPQNGDPARAVEEFQRNLDAMDAMIARCEEKFGGVKVGKHPIFGPLTPTQWRRFHWLHARHHAKQVAARRAAMPRTQAAEGG